MKIKEIEELFTEAQRHRVIAHESVYQCLTHGPELVKRVREQDAENKALREALRSCLSCMKIQERREDGSFHLSVEAFRPVWDEAKARAVAALESKGGG